MSRTLLERVRQGHRTIKYPHAAPPELPDRWLGRPQLVAARCGDPVACAGVCPVGALDAAGGELRLDMGKCIFCGDCQAKSDAGGISFSREFNLATFSRQDLVVGSGVEAEKGDSGPSEIGIAARREARLALIRRLFKRSLKLRQVSAGGCNACEADSNVLTTVAWDIGRFGINFVASPRHADGILVTGPVTPNMLLALRKTYDAIPDPKLVIAVGACAVSGGMFAPEAGKGGLDGIMPVDLYIPGCPPHPLVILEGLLRLLGIVD